ncbi:MAG: hypothetical protein FD131_3967 [Rhodocyclaceae bacterium]|nr:MAG: hypothetical protein FD131_3967 [Rhodocyclaceae bacterium]
MALIQCPECESSVSDTALKCPKCGVQLRKPVRSAFGKIVKWVFILFNALMAIVMYNGMSAATQVVATANGGAEQAGAAIGTGIGAFVILAIWGFGAVILGLITLLTRPK